jgi:hypothetical protein
MDINCKQYTTQANCYNYTTNCRWAGSKGCIKRNYVNDGSRYEGPVFQPQTVEEYIQVAQLPPAQLINEVHFIDNSSDLFKTITHKGNILEFNTLITGLNCTEYSKYHHKSFFFFYERLMSLLRNYLKTGGNIGYIVYVRFLQFMEIEILYLKSCYKIEDIEIKNADLPTAKIITPINVFNNILKRCENTITNILIPVLIFFSDGGDTHRNTLIVTQDKEVYLIEPNGINDNYITKLFEKYFKETEYKFMGFYKYQLNYCRHGGFCNLFAILLYFLKSDKIYEYSELKEYIVKYFMWEYNNICKKPYIENENSMFDVIQYINDNPNKRNELYLNGRAIRTITDKLSNISIFDNNQIISSNVVINDELKNIISGLKNPKITYAINLDFNTLSSSNKIENNKNSFGKKQKSILIINSDIKYLLRR